MSWTDERVATLKKLWTDGYSASEIAKILTGTTRNAVIGKAHRLGLASRSSPISRQTVLTATKPKTASAPIKLKSTIAPTPSAYMPPAVAFALAESARTQTTGARTFSNAMFSSARACQWPVGDPRSTDFHFCGGDCVGGHPYCLEHAKQAYQAPSKKRISVGGTDMHSAGTPDEREIIVRA